MTIKKDHEENNTPDPDNEGIFDIACSHDGRIIAGGTTNQQLHIWDAKSLEVKFTIEGHTDKVYGTTFPSDDRLLASLSEDSTMRLWNTENWKEVGKIVTKSTGNYSSI